MAAVGITDVYRYGTRFLGALLVAVLASGVLVGAGVALVGTADLASLSGSNSSQAIAGVVLIALGGLVALSSLFGLAHKLIADAILVGTAAGIAAEVGTADDSPADETEADDSPTGADTGTGAGPAGVVAGDGTDAPSTDATADPDALDETGPVDAAEPEPTSVSAASSSGDQPSEPDDAEPVAEARDADRADVSPDDSGSDREELSADDFAPKEPTASSEPEAIDDDAGADTAEEQPGSEPEEWTPPDPAEFETASADVDESAREETPETDAGRDDIFAGDDAEAVDTPRTAADLFGDSPSDQGSSEESGEALDDDAPDSDDDAADSDETLADEGVEGFEPASDKDPLSDALDDE